MITDVVYDENLDELSDMDDTTIKMLRKDAMIKKNEAGLLELKRELAQKEEIIAKQNAMISLNDKVLDEQKAIISLMDKISDEQKMLLSHDDDSVDDRDDLLLEYIKDYANLKVLLEKHNQRMRDLENLKFS